MDTGRFLGTVSTVLICLIYCIGRFQKSRKAILALDLTAKVLSVLMFFFFSQTTGVFTELIGLTVLVTAYVKEINNDEYRQLFGAYRMIYTDVPEDIQKRGSREYRALFYLYLAVYTAVMIFTFSGFPSLLVTGAAVLSLSSNWWFSAQKMRLADIAICAMMFVLDMSIGNYAGFTELIIMICNVVSYRKFRQHAHRHSVFSLFRRQVRVVRRMIASAVLR